ncbi:MAG TPA: TraR/DksA C4-type zinc finger protein [Gaiellaceae bacterium]|jgi:DnaK suppressor protein|nr:TraR/DksA C4-type zinc finger protein [Gaiellaceae bacterium]
MSAVDTQHFRELLLEKRQAVVDALDYLHKENRGSLEDETGELVSGSADQHLADTATETVDREIDYTLEASDGRLLAAIDGALARIEDGTYGACVNCGAQIPPERLEAMPWATLCIECKRKEERG